MSHKTPSWWYEDSKIIPFLLSPVSYIYGMAVQYRWSTTKPYISELPVICVGNFTMGGAGKTPTALYLSELLKRMGQRPVFLSRGYGGNVRGPHLVTLADDKSSDVGDEPLLLARRAPTVVSANRPEGARFIAGLVELSPTVIIMDDGFQNPSLKKDLNIIVVDGARGIGNGRIFPAGPLRESMDSQAPRGDIMVTIGEEGSALSDELAISQVRGMLRSKTTKEAWHNQAVIAYSGIARPGKFYTTLRELGVNLLETIDFPDHHPFSEADARSLLMAAEQANAQLVTTEKDIVRLDGLVSPFSELKNQSKVLAIELELKKEDEDVLVSLLNNVLNK